MQGEIDNLKYNLSGFDGQIISPQYTPMTSMYVNGSDGVLTSQNGFNVTQVELNGATMVKFLGLKTDSAINAGYAFGHYEEGHIGEEEYWHTDYSSRFDYGASLRIAKDYEIANDYPAATHFRTTSSTAFAELKQDDFYIYFGNGKIVKEAISEIQGGYKLRSDLLGKDYVNMSSSTFSSVIGGVEWHRDLVTKMGMIYNNIGRGGSFYRCFSDTQFNLNYQDLDTQYEHDWVILNQVANLLTQHVNSGYYPHFVVSCCGLNDVKKTLVPVDSNLQELIGSADDALQMAMPSLDCTSAANIESSFSAFYSSVDYATLKTKLMNCMRIALEVLLRELPKTQIIVVSTQQVTSTSFNQDAITYMNNEQRKLCQYYSIPFVEMKQEVGINAINGSTFLGDGLHPNTNGRLLYTGYMKNKLNQVLNPRF